jgi:hypothetical protein
VPRSSRLYRDERVFRSDRGHGEIAAFGGRRGFQPPQYGNRMNEGFSPGWTVFKHCARNSTFSGGTFNPVRKRILCNDFQRNPRRFSLKNLRPNIKPEGRSRMCLSSHVLVTIGFNYAANACSKKGCTVTVFALSREEPESEQGISCR